MRNMIIAGALTLLMATGADAAQFMFRPPAMKNPLLPMDAIEVPDAGDGYVFKSGNFDDSSSIFDVPVRTAAVALSGQWENGWLPPVAWCEIREAAQDDVRKKSGVMGVPSGSHQERQVMPLVAGRMALVFICDAIDGVPGEVYVGKVELTVTP